MNREEVGQHELKHLLAALAGLILYASRCAQKSGLDLFREANVYFTASPDVEEGTLGEFGLGLDDTAARHFALGCAALAPDVSENKVAKTIQAKSVAPLLQSVSDTDLACYQKYPVDVADVVVAGLAAKYFLNRLGNKKAKYISLVDEAARRNDNLLKMSDVVCYDNLSHCLKLAKQFYKARLEDADPALQHQREDEAARRRFEAKRVGYANASPSERLRRDGKGIGKTLGFK